MMNYFIIITLLIILLLEGFITISIEILAIRQLIPFFGGSVVITSIIIGVFLLFLAIGYWRGGLRRPTNVFRTLYFNFIFALFWIGIGLSYHGITLLFSLSNTYSPFPLLVNLILYLLLVLAPIVFWLGQTIPLSTHLFNQTLGVSRISGRALFLSTLGSFLGSILTSMYFFNSFGVAWTVVIDCCLLFSLILFLHKKSRASWWSIFFLIFGLASIKLLNVDVGKTQFIKTTNYANYEILHFSNHDKLLRINHSNSSLITANNGTFPYIEFIQHVLFDTLKLKHKKILIIGAGGFTLTNRENSENEILYVDIDPDIRNIVETYFLNKSIQGQFIGQDARAYLNQTDTAFDIIFADAYSNKAAIPPWLLTLDYFTALAHHLKKNGLLILNVIHDPWFKTAYAKRVYNTIHTIFPYCALIPIGLKKGMTKANMIYLCPKRTKSDVVYQDDLSTATLDFLKASPLME